MAPIRIGFVGLSTRGWARKAHWPYILQDDKYTITALLNSSVESAEASRRYHSLPDAVRCYGSPNALASDPDVDLVVCAVRVDKHFDILKPALQAGKEVYCEWPLAVNAAQAEELAALARENACRTMVGLQSRVAPFVLTLKALVDSGRIGRVISSNLAGFGDFFGPTVPEPLRYFAEKAVGGNMLSIHFGQLIDYFCFVLGELESFTGLASIQRPLVDVLDAQGKRIDTVKRETYDQLMFQGTLKSGGVVSVHQHGPRPFKGEPGLLWTIYGDKGEILVDGGIGGSMLQICPDDMRMRLHEYERDNVEVVDWQKQVSGQKIEELPTRARNVARLYEAWAEGKDELFVNMDGAVKRQRILEQLVNSSETGTRLIVV